MEILESKPNQPIPKMYNILHKITEEKKQEQDEQALDERGEHLTDAEFKEYKELLHQKQ